MVINGIVEGDNAVVNFDRKKNKRTSTVIFKTFSIFPNVSNVKVKLLESKNIYQLEFEFFWKENIKGKARKLRRTPGLPPKYTYIVVFKWNWRDFVFPFLLYPGFFLERGLMRVDQNKTLAEMPHPKSYFYNQWKVSSKGTLSADDDTTKQVGL